MYLEAGDPQHALDYYARSAVLTDSLGLPDEHATLLRNQARALRAAGNLPRAYRLASEAVVEHERGGFQYPAMRDRLLLADWRRTWAGRPTRRVYLRLARAFAARVGAPIASAEVALVAARVAAMRAQWRKGDPRAQWRRPEHQRAGQ